MAFSSNMKEYLVRKRQEQDLVEQIPSLMRSKSVVNLSMRGYAGGEIRISGKDAERKTMEIINAW